MATARSLGVDVMDALPLLGPGMAPRRVEQVARRMLAMQAVVRVANGVAPVGALQWLWHERAITALTASEARFLRKRIGEPRRFRVLVEGLWALAWAMSLVKGPDFCRPRDDDLDALMPLVAVADSGAAFRGRLMPRPVSDLVAACDLSYCLHWALVEEALRPTRRAGKLDPDMVVERRRALEWLLSRRSWGNVVMDT